MRYPIVFSAEDLSDSPFFPLIASMPLLEKSLTTTPKQDYFTWDGLKLSWIGENPSPLIIDFSSPKLLWRLSKLNKAQEPLLRALGWKGNQAQNVWDLTAGLGRDSVLLAYAGFNVTLFERSPVLQCLLQYALAELKFVDDAVADRMQIKPVDALTFLKSLDETNSEAVLPDLIYLDPMYPHRKKSALVKLDIRMVRDLVGDDEDSDQLLECALGINVKRVVVKRPAKAPFLAGIKPHHSIDAPNTRFDVYEGITRFPLRGKSSF